MRGIRQVSETGLGVRRGRYGGQHKHKHTHETCVSSAKYSSQPINKQSPTNSSNQSISEKVNAPIFSSTMLSPSHPTPNQSQAGASVSHPSLLRHCSPPVE